MKLSANTISILENFASINGNLTINPGNTIQTMHANKTIFATAQLEEMFDRQFGIYDLKMFLSTLAMFKNPSLTFSDHYVDIIDDDDSSIHTRYWSSDIDLLTKIPTLKQMPDPIVTFELSSINIKRVLKATSVLGVQHILFEGKDGKITVTAFDNSKVTNNDFTVILDENYQGPDFKARILKDKMVAINGDYFCSLIANKIIKMTNKSRPVEYVITLDIQ